MPHQEKILLLYQDGSLRFLLSKRKAAKVDSTLHQEKVLPLYQDESLRFLLSKRKAVKVDSTVILKVNDPLRLELPPIIRERAFLFYQENLLLDKPCRSLLDTGHLVEMKPNQSNKITQAISAHCETNHSSNRLTQADLPTAVASLNTVAVSSHRDQYSQ